MSASDISAAHAAPEADTRAILCRAIFTLISIGVPILIWFAPFGIEPAAQQLHGDFRVHDSAPG